MAYDVFISHSTRDKAVCDAVCAALENARIRCWIAPRDVQPGRSFAGEITRAIQQSKAMVLIFSAHSNSSEQVLREVQLAVESHLHIVQFRIENVHLNDDLKYFLSTPHWLDALTPPLENHIQRLGVSIKTLLGAPAEERGVAPAMESTAKSRDPAVIQQSKPGVVVSPPGRPTLGLEPTRPRKKLKRLAIAFLAICICAIAGWWFVYQPARRARGLDSTQDKSEASQTDLSTTASTPIPKSQPPRNGPAATGTDPDGRRAPGKADAAVHGNKGHELALAHKYDEAIIEYTKAIEISPRDVRLYMDRGLVYRAATKIQEATADFTKAIELEPKNELGYFERGRTELGQNQFDPALTDLNKAIELNPNNLVAVERRGLVYHNLKKWDQAIADYTIAITKDPNNAMAFRRRADTYVAMSQFKQAVTDLETALRLLPDDPDITQNLEYLHARMRRRTP